MFDQKNLNFENLILVIFLLMGRKAKKCPKNCLKHLLILKPVHYSAFFSRESSMSFCP